MCRSTYALLLLLMMASCGSGVKSKEKVQEAIVNRLQTHSGLDLKSLDVTTTAVSFDKDMAYATVAFHPKGDPAVNSGMVMKYTLQQRDGHWVVINVGDSQGHGMPGHGGVGGGASGDGQLPPGHPSVGSANPHAQPLDQGADRRAQ